jgi:hypothetical protein
VWEAKEQSREITFLARIIEVAKFNKPKIDVKFMVHIHLYPFTKSRLFGGQ